MSEERKQLLIRIPKDLHDWLMTNVKDQSLSDFFTELANSRRNETHENETDWGTLSPELEKIMDLREKTLLWSENWERIDTNEKRVRNCKRLGMPLDLEDLTEKEKEYLLALQALSDEDLAKFYSIARMQDKKISRMLDDRYYHGDPDEVVYRSITRKKIYSILDKRNVHSILSVAGELGLNYYVTYINVIPWMLRDGWRIGKPKTKVVLRSHSKRVIRKQHTLSKKEKLVVAPRS